MRRFFTALGIYLGTQFSWATAWRHAGDKPKHIDAPYHAVEKEDGFEYVEPRPE